MNTKKFSVIILSFGLIFSAILIGNALAQTATGPGASSVANVQFPVAELGNCQSETECKTYCDKPANREKCLNFAQKNNLMNQEEIDAARKFMAMGKGPGDCSTKESCEKYCDEISHIDECVTFAEKNGVLSPKELDEAQKVRNAIKQGVKPPSCGNKKSCDAYCSSADHMEECMTFAQAAGLMNEKEKQESQKFLEAIKKGAKPPQCRGKEECDVYCSEESHFEECMKFAEAAGFMSAEDAEMARKTGGKGPGGCRSKEQCESFCASPDNQEACFNFAKEHGLIKPGDLRQMEEGKQKFQEMLNQAPPKVIECLTSTIGSEMMGKLKSGTAMPPREIGDKMRTCFESNMGAPGMGPGGPGGPGQAGGGMPSFESMPQELKECLRTNLGKDAVGRLQSGVMKDEEKGEFMQKAKTCFEQFGPKQQPGDMQGPQMPQRPGEGGQIPTGPQMPPQGTIKPPCSSPEECKEFCSKSGNPEECLKGIQQRTMQIQPQMPSPGPNSGQYPMQPQQMPPGGQTSSTQQYPGVTPPPTQLQPQQMPGGQTSSSQQYPGGMMPPTQPVNQQQIQYPQPPSGNMAPPPNGSTTPPPPPSSANKSLLGKVIYFFKSLLGQ